MAETYSGLPRAAVLPSRLVGVSLKMYFDVPQTLEYLTALTRSAFVKPTFEANETSKMAQSAALFVIPSFPLLAHPTTQSLIHDPLPDSPTTWLGAQNCHSEDRGAWTGEVSPLMLAQLGIKIVEIGHAERRASPFNEEELFLRDKVQACVKNGMVPLLCIGERERTSVEDAVEEVWRQSMTALSSVLTDRDADDGATSSQLPRVGLVLAYEPVWAIGASRPADPEYVVAVVGALRARISDAPFGRPLDIRILYGGSAGPGTWEKLKPACDGLFLGRFAHNIQNLQQTWAEVMN